MAKICGSRGCKWPIPENDDICEHCAVVGTPAQIRANARAGKADKKTDSRTNRAAKKETRPMTDTNQPLDDADAGPALTIETGMESAGAEIMNLAWDIEKVPELADRAERIRNIGAWISMSRMSDMETAMFKMMGSVLGAMAKRNFPFREDQPIATQFIAFFDSVPEPVPGEAGYIDQSTLPPTERSDAFEAHVAMTDVRKWTSADGVDHALARSCSVHPRKGPEGVGVMVYASGKDVSLLEDGGKATLTLRSAGPNTLKVVQTKPA